MRKFKILVLIAVVAVAGLMTSCGPTTYVYDPYPNYGYRTYYIGNIYTRPLPPPPPPRYHAPAPKPHPNHNPGGRGRR